MSPRHFWNHPLQELARSLVHTVKAGDPEPLTGEEFAAFLGRLVGTAAAGPVLQPARGSAPRRLPSRYDRDR
jgi:hypothetical protein